MSSISITVETTLGTSITSKTIPEMIALANRMGIDVECDCNGVKVIARPGDDEIDLAMAWEGQIGNKDACKIAVAWRGRVLRLRALSATPPTKQR